MSIVRVAASTSPETVAPRTGPATAPPPSAAAAVAPEGPSADRAADDFFRALGRVTASFAALEHQLQVLASLLISRTDQELGRIVTAELSFRKLVDVVSSLARYRMGDEPRHRELNALLARAATAEDRRRCVTPAEWGPGSVAETRVRVRMALRKNRGLRLELPGMTAADVDEVAAEASAIAAEVSKTWARLSRERRFRGIAG
jgi:hypothetical protein